MVRSYCYSCHKELGLLDLLIVKTQVTRCLPCHKEARKKLQDVRDLLALMTDDGELLPEAWDELVGIAEQRNLHLHDVQESLRTEGVHLFHNVCLRLEQKSEICQEDEERLQFLRSAFALSQDDIAVELTCLDRLRHLIAVQAGTLEPLVIGADEIFEAGENVFYRTRAVYLCTEKRKTRSREAVTGLLTMTGKQMYFKPGQSRAMRVKLRNVTRAFLRTANIIHLEVAQGEGEGEYTILDADPEMALAYIQTLVRQAKHHLSSMQSTTLPPWQNDIEPPRSKYDSPAELAFLACWNYAYKHVPLSHQHPIQMVDKTYRLDFAHPPTMTAVEIDGFDGHGNARAIQKDHRRQREIEALGWSFIRFSGLDIKENPLDVAHAVYARIEERTQKLNTTKEKETHGA
jgi:very-short-patch-repair endonuclease